MSSYYFIGQSAASSGGTFSNSTFSGTSTFAGPIVGTTSTFSGALSGGANMIQPGVSANLTVNGAVYTDNGVTGTWTATLPAATGSGMLLTVLLTRSMPTILQAAGTDKIHVAGTASATGGVATSSMSGASVVLLDQRANNWLSLDVQGNWTIT